MRSSARQIFSANVMIVKSGRGSSVVEQPIRNRQVASSTLALGSSSAYVSGRSFSALSVLLQPHVLRIHPTRLPVCRFHLVIVVRLTCFHERHRSAFLDCFDGFVCTRRVRPQS